MQEVYTLCDLCRLSRRYGHVNKAGVRPVGMHETRQSALMRLMSDCSWCTHASRPRNALIRGNSFCKREFCCVGNGFRQMGFQDSFDAGRRFRLGFSRSVYDVCIRRIEFFCSFFVMAATGIFWKI